MLPDILRHLEARGCEFVPRLLESDPELLKIVTTNCGSVIEHISDERMKEIYDELASYGVRHEDAFMRNITYRASDGRLCVIDFEFATLLDDPAGDDHGAGDLVYPQAAAFTSGDLDLTARAERPMLVGTWAGAEFVIGEAYASSVVEHFPLFGGVDLPMDYEFSAAQRGRPLRTGRGRPRRAPARLAGVVPARVRVDGRGLQHRLGHSLEVHEHLSVAADPACIGLHHA